VLWSLNIFFYVTPLEYDLYIWCWAVRIVYIFVKIYNKINEPHNLYVAPAQGTNFDAAPVPVSTLSCRRPTFLNYKKVYRVGAFFL
jgi:hypothetical protein